MDETKFYEMCEQIKGIVKGDESYESIQRRFSG